MKLPNAWTLCAALAVGSANAQTGEVELNLRLQPDRDLTTESTSEALTSLRVVEDRGVVAKSEGRLSAQPVTLHLHTRQRMRLVTGAAQADGSWPVEMQFVDKTVEAQLPDGSRQPLPQGPRFDGLKIVARAEAGGALRPGSVDLPAATEEQRKALLPVMGAALQQMAAMESVRLQPDRSVPQQLAMQLPLPGIGTLNVRMQVLHRLLGVEAGIARVQQSYAMDFDTPPGVLKMTAEGSGNGTMRYDVAARQVSGNETNLQMKMLLDMPEGLIEVQVRSRQAATTTPR